MKKIAVSLLALTLAVFLAVPAMAEFEPYAEVKLITGWSDIQGNDAEPGKSLGGTEYPYTQRDDEDLAWDLCDFSVFGAKFKTGDLGGHVEFEVFGSHDGTGAHDNAVEIALMYGTWDFAGGTVKVGQDYAPYTFKSAQIAPNPLRQALGLAEREIDGQNRFIGYGCLWDWYEPQIELRLDNGFYVALIQPEVVDEADMADIMNSVLGPGTFQEENVDVDTDIPKIVVGYEFKTEGLMLNPGFAYHICEYTDKSNDWDADIDSYLLYLNTKVDVGPATVQGSFHYGENLGNFGLENREAFAYAMAEAGGDIEDAVSYGGYIQVAFPVDPVTITLGYGYTRSETDSNAIETEYGGDTDEQQSYFVQAKIPIAETFFIVPELSYFDMMDIGDYDEPEAWFAGIMWQMDF